MPTSNADVTTPPCPPNDSEERYRSIVNQSLVGIAEIAGNIQFTMVNKRYCEMVGYSQEELLGRSSRDVVHPDDLADVIERFYQNAKIASTFEMELRYRRKDGAVIWVHNSVVLVNEPDGQIRSIIIVCIDITARKKTEAALRLSEERYRTLFNSIDEGYALVEMKIEPDQPLDCLYIETNASFEEQSTVQNAKGRWMRELCPDLEEYWYEMMRDVALSGIPVRVENRAEALDNRWYTVYVTRIGPEGSRTLGVLFKNITARKLEQQALRESDERLRQAVENLEHHVRERTAELKQTNEELAQEIAERKQTEEALAEINETLATLIRACPLSIISFDCKGLVKSWNHRAEKMFGWSAEEVLNKTLPHLPLENRERYVREVEHCLTREMEFLETRRRRKDGTVFEVSIWTAPVRNSRGERIATVALAADITERRWLERALLEATEHEQQRIGRDLHDGLCQSIAALSLMASMLERGLRTRNEPAASEAATLSKLLLQVLDEARWIARGLHPVELATGGIALTLQGLAKSVNASIPCELIVGTKLIIQDEGRALHLYRIAQEAVQNAIKHSKPKSIRISLLREGLSMNLCIEDDGCGFEPAAVSQHASMGLATMKYRAKAIGAIFQIHSKLGKGTRVECCLPIEVPIVANSADLTSL